MADRQRQGAETGDLASRIAAAKAKHAHRPRRPQGAIRGWELGFRMMLELVVGIAIGGAMGYGLDWLIGSLPLFTIVLGLFGFAAGIRVMLRSAEEVNRPRGAPKGDGADTP
ncbi:MAG: AtpZ/AtpI family protein [Pseudomonadota bacterium]